jgi:hypothetical protein
MEFILILREAKGASKWLRLRRVVIKFRERSSLAKLGAFISGRCYMLMIRFLPI